MIRGFLLACALLFASPALAQTYPALTGRVVDTANLLSPEQEAALVQKLEALEVASSRQLVVATVPDLQGYEIEDYGVGLGRAWRIGQAEANNGVILIVAVAERKIRIEVAYGLEGVLTDALAAQIIRRDIRPRFRENDYPGGITAGADAIIEQLQAPPEAAEQRALAAAQAEKGNREGASLWPLLFWVIVLGFTLIPMLARGMRGKKYRGRRRGGPVVIWGPGLGSGWDGGSSSGWGGGSWGGGGGGGGFGGFSGGGGSFGGGGASGGW